MIRKSLLLTSLIIFISSGAFGQAYIDIKSTIEWDTMQVKASVSLDLAAAGVRLPSGRTQAESLLSTGYLNLVRPGLLELPVDSSATIANLIDMGEFTLLETEKIALNAHAIAPSLSSDMRSLTASYTMPLATFSSALLRHNRPYPVMRTLTPVSAAQYTGIIIIATDALPVYGRKSTDKVIPCLFPKIWDSEMNLIYDKNMLEPRDITMVRYAPSQSIFQKTPSGLSAEVTERVGDRPLRIFARGVFGVKPTDIIIDQSDAMLIISKEANRRLLSEGRVAVIIDESLLRSEF
jgi:hypothetical protein